MDYPEDSECSLLSVSKSVMFLIIAVFLLYLPLGDPQEHCMNFISRENNGAVCCICDLHKYLVKTAKKAAEVTQIITCALLEGLYEAKLRFYSLLEILDKKDLCRSVCCPLKEDQSLTENRDTKRPCRCVKKTCSKRHT